MVYIELCVHVTNIIHALSNLGLWKCPSYNLTPTIFINIIYTSGNIYIYIFLYKKVGVLPIRIV